MQQTTQLKESVAEQQALALQNIETVFGNCEFALVGTMVESIDLFFSQHLITGLLSNIHIIFDRATKSNNSHQFECMDLCYQINIGENVLNFGQLDIIVFELTHRKPPMPIDLQIDLPDSLGRYKNICFTVPKSLKLNKNYVNELCVSLAHTIYTWATEYVRNALSSEGTALAKELYTRVKVYQPNKKLWNSIWFCVVVNGEGCWLLEDSILDNLFCSIDKAVFGTRESALILLNEFLSAVIPFEKINAYEVFNAKKAMDFEINKSSYAKEEILYTIAEQTVFSSGRMTIYPLFLETKTSLYAIFSSDYNITLKPLFQRHAEEFAQIFSNTKNRIHQFKKRCEGIKYGFDYGKLGEFIGGIGKALIG